MEEEKVYKITLTTKGGEIYQWNQGFLPHQTPFTWIDNSIQYMRGMLNIRNERAINIDMVAQITWEEEDR